MLEPVSTGAAGPESARAQRWLEIGSLCLAVLALFALSFRYMDLLGDSFWSVATGRWILEHASLPKTDPFSFTANRPWIVHMPLSQLCFAWIEGHFGALALELFGALVLGAALLTIGLPHARGPHARLLCFCTLALLVFLQADDLCVRGQLFGDWAFAVLLGCLFRLRLGKPVHPAFAVLLGALWINLHSSAFLAVLLPLGWAALLRLDRTRPAPKPFLLFAALAALGLFVNPYGVHLVVDLLRLFVASSTQHIDLFRAPDFTALPTLIAFALMAAAAAVAILRPASGLGLPEAALLVLWAVAGASARRYLPLGAALASVVLARRASLSWPSVSSSPSARASVLALLALAAGTAFWSLSADKDPWRDVPLEEASLVDQLGLPDHVVNSYQWGGFLDYAWNGRRKVFVDGRNQLFEHGAFEDARRLGGLDGWSAILDRYRANTVIWERNSPLDLALAASPAWALVRRGRIAVLYVRKEPLPLR